MADSRLLALLREAANALGDLRDPFSTDWLSKHQVTADECYDLSIALAMLIRGYVSAPPETQKAVKMAAARNLSSELLERKLPEKVKE